MDKYYTLMIIPEREKGVKSIRIPRVVFRAFSLVTAVALIIVALLAHDYWKILEQVYENKHLTLENKHLKDQIQIFQMKYNALADDIERITHFEEKLRTISGLRPLDRKESQSLKDLYGENPKESQKQENHEESLHLQHSGILKTPLTPGRSNDYFSQTQKMRKELKRVKQSKDPQFVKGKPKYTRLKKLYEQKMASHFGMHSGHSYTKEWSQLIKQSFGLTHNFALIDFQFSAISSTATGLETRLNQLDQHLLDKSSFLKSTPTLLPTQGWITSYYGPRVSPTSGQYKMHEGLDIGASYGTPIKAPADGIVTFSGIKPGFGKFVQINHGYGVETIYAHTQKLLVKKGQQIKRGHLIAQVGSSGSSTGPHLHYEVRQNGSPVDPLYYIFN